MDKRFTYINYVLHVSMQTCNYVSLSPIDLIALYHNYDIQTDHISLSLYIADGPCDVLLPSGSSSSCFLPAFSFFFPLLALIVPFAHHSPYSISYSVICFLAHHSFCISYSVSCSLLHGSFDIYFLNWSLLLHIANKFVSAFCRSFPPVMLGFIA